MTDTKDTSTHHDDDVFQFDEFDAPEGTGSQSASSASASSTHTDWQNNFGQKNPRKLIIFGAIAVIIIIFIVYHFASSWNNPLEELSKTSRAVVPSHPAVKTQVASAPAVATAATEIENKVNTLERSVNQQNQTITQLQGTIGSLQDNINAMNTTVNNVSSQLDAINTQLTKPKKTALAPTNTGPVPIKYIVKAMVPGRAWLQAGDGSTLSVSVGSEVPQRGTVTQVDLTGGQVLTSDGSAITYDINGN